MTAPKTESVYCLPCIEIQAQPSGVLQLEVLGHDPGAGQVCKPLQAGQRQGFPSSVTINQGLPSVSCPMGLSIGQNVIRASRCHQNEGFRKERFF